MKNALITGASRGLGLALARELAEEGWGLVIDGRGKAALDRARAELALQTTVVAVAGNVTSEAHRRRLAQAVKGLGGLDLIVNNASSLGPSPQPHLLEYPLDVLEQVYRTNVIAPLAIIQGLRPALREGARIINVTSDAGAEAYGGWAVTARAKPRWSSSRRY